MGEAFGRDAAAAAALQRVVADGLGRAHAFLKVAGLQRHLTVRHRRRIGGPDAGVAVGLKLQCDGLAVGLGLARRALLRLTHLLRGAGQGLDVVAELVGDDIGAGEIGAGCAQLRLHLAPEA